MRKRYLWGPATALAVALLLAAGAASARLDDAPPRATPASSPTEVIDTVADEGEIDRPVVRRLRTVQDGELVGATPARRP